MLSDSCSLIDHENQLYVSLKTVSNFIIQFSKSKKINHNLCYEAEVILIRTKSINQSIEFAVSRADAIEQQLSTAAVNTFVIGTVESE